MTKMQLVNIVAKQAHLPKKAAKQAIDAFLEEITRTLAKGDKVVLSGFGTFSVNPVNDKVVEPFGKKELRMTVKGHNVVNFKAGTPLRKKVW